MEIALTMKTDMRIFIVREACKSTLGPGVTEDVLKGPVPVLMKLAVDRAFCFKLEGPEVETLRAAARALQYEGRYLIGDR